MSKHTIWTINFYFQECLLCILRSQLEKKKKQWTQMKEPRFLCPRNWDKNLTLITVDGSRQFILPFFGVVYRREPWTLSQLRSELPSHSWCFSVFSPPTEFWWGKKRIFWPTCVHLAKGWKVNLLDGAPKWPPFNLQNKKSCLKEIKHNRCRV